jgi:hypothetical protein
LRHRPWASVAITAIYAVNPINWYAVYHVAPAQILAANAIALLTWCGVVLWRRGQRLAWKCTGLLVAAFALIFGSYNFIIVVCLVPAVAYAGIHAWRQRRWGPLGGWCMRLAVPLVVAGALFPQRSLGVVERLLLLRSGFGWDIPAFTPEGWLGLVDGAWLRAHPTGVRVVLLLIVTALIVVPLLKARHRRPEAVFLAGCLTVPILIGYAGLQLRSYYYNTNATYEAYKLFSVFYPGILAAFCFFLNGVPGERRWPIAVAAAALFAGNLGGEWRLFYRVLSPAEVVDETLVATGRIEAMTQVASVNLRLSDGWERLWTSAFILRKPHYFEVHSYEARRSTSLRGEWDLLGSFFRVELPENTDCLHPGAEFTLMRRASPHFMEPGFGHGWTDAVRDDSRAQRRTSWSSEGAATIRLNNPQREPLTVELRARLRAMGQRECEVFLDGTQRARLVLGVEPQVWEGSELVLLPGETILEFRTEQPPDYVGGRVKRPLTFAVDGLDIRVISMSR